MAIEIDQSYNRRKHGVQSVAFGIFRILSYSVVAILFLILGFIIIKGIGVINWDFLTMPPTDGMTAGGIMPAIVGTFWLMVGSAVFAFPVGVMSGIYMNEYAPKGKVVAFIRTMTNNLAGIPSIVFGLFGMAFFVNYLGFGDSIILSRQSENKKVAKDFLRYMARESTCIKFSEDVPGTALAFKYDLNECEFGDNRFAKDIAAILTTVPAINIYSSSSLAIRLGSETLNPWPQNTFYYKNSWQDPDTYTASYIVDNIYDTLKILWPGWEMQ